MIRVSGKIFRARNIGEVSSFFMIGHPLNLMLFLVLFHILVMNFSDQDWSYKETFDGDGNLPPVTYTLVIINLCITLLTHIYKQRGYLSVDVLDLIRFQ